MEFVTMLTSCNQEILTLEDYLKFKNDGFEFIGQSYLFWEFVYLLQELKPKYFLLENVVMTKHWKDVITSILGVQCICIDSALLSAQRRKRLYWTNIPNVTQPEDKGILFKDIVESGEVDKDKSYCLDASYAKGTNVEQYLSKSRRQIVFEDNSEEITTAVQGRYIATMIGRRVNSQGKRDDYNKNLKIEQFVEQRHTGKSNCLTTVQKDNVIIYEPLTERTPVHQVKYRYLTISECEKLQTFPVGYVGNAGISKSQAYKALGNSWTVDVITHIFGGLKCDTTTTSS